MNEFRNDELKEAIQAFQADENPDSVKHLMDVLTSTRLLAPAQWDKEPIQNEQGQMVFEPNTKFQLLIIQTDKNECYFPMFTDMEELRKWDKDAQIESLVMDFDQYIPFVEMGVKDVKGIVINPYGECLPFDSDFLISLHKQRKGMVNITENTLAEGERVNLRDPVRNVEKLVDKLCELAQEDDRIQKVYLRERLVKNKPSHWFVVVEMEQEDPKIFQKIGEGCKPVNFGKDIEFAFTNSMVGLDVARETQPIYEKKS